MKAATPPVRPPQLTRQLCRGEEVGEQALRRQPALEGRSQVVSRTKKSQKSLPTAQLD